MPPRLHSRHTFTLATRFTADALGRRFLKPREPYRFVQRDDNRIHVVRSGDSLYSLAAKYFRGFKRLAGLWWIIADFQPQPIHDPTIVLTPGTVLHVPSRRTVEEDIFGEKRRWESTP